MAKELIEKSIEIYGMGHPDVKTVFNIEHEFEKKDPMFRSLLRIAGRKLTVWFKYKDTVTEEETQSQVQLSIPRFEDEDDVKIYILAEINKTLA